MDNIKTNRSLPPGLLNSKDANVLALYAARAATKFKDLDMLEIGAWRGRSAFIIASELKRLKAKTYLYSIDPHKGMVEVGRQLDPTYETFCRNMEKYEVDEFVRCIRKRAQDVTWDRPISLLFIDALHAYKNVKHDFEKFASWVVDGGYIVLHDYGLLDGPTRYVDKEVLPLRRFKQRACVKHTIVLEKING